MNYEPPDKSYTDPNVPFIYRVYWYPKDEGSPQAYEDAYTIRPDTSRIAVSDGASSTIFSSRMAQLLTASVTASPLDVNDPLALEAWLSGLKAEWKETFDFKSLPWNQRGKLKQYGGGAATLLWIELFPSTDSPPANQGPYRLRGFAIGDCCLFHIRNGELLSTFPIQSLEEFGNDPKTLSATRKIEIEQIAFETWESECEVGDLIVLATDAIAQWFYRQIDRGDEIDWHAFDQLSSEEWESCVRQMRNEDKMRHDDTTLLLLRIGKEDDIIGPPQAPAQPQEQPTQHGDDKEKSGDEKDAEDREQKPDTKGTHSTDAEKDSSSAKDKPERLAPLKDHVGLVIAFLIAEFALFGTLFDLLTKEFVRTRGTQTPDTASVHATILSSWLENGWFSWIIIGSICLLCSSAMTCLALKARSRDRHRTYLAWLGVTILLGIGFLLGIASQWHINPPLAINTSKIGNTIHALIGFHTFHVLIGIIALIVFWILEACRRLQPTSNAPRLMLWYWNFVVGVWMSILVLIWLTGR